MQFNADRLSSKGARETRRFVFEATLLLACYWLGTLSISVAPFSQFDVFSVESWE